MLGEYQPLVLLTGVFTLLTFVGFLLDYRAHHPRRSRRDSGELSHGRQART